MFQLSVQDIHPGEKAGDKEEAIRQVAAALVQAGNVAEGYVNGMLAREQQTSTFLGNGIAIPHGTTDTRDQVLKTGVQVFQFPEGVTWGDGQVAYVAIGIAASSDEHLGLLRQLTTAKDAPGSYVGVPDDFSKIPMDLLVAERHGVAATYNGDAERAMAGAGECAQRITDLPPCADMVQKIAAETEEIICGLKSKYVV